METAFQLPPDIAEAYDNEVDGALQNAESILPKLTPDLNALRPHGAQLAQMAKSPEHAAIRNVLLLLLILIGMPELAAQEGGMDEFLSNPDAVNREIDLATRALEKAKEVLQWLEPVVDFLQKWGPLGGIAALGYRWYIKGKKLAINTGQRLVEDGHVNLGFCPEQPTLLGHDGNGNWTMTINSVQEQGTVLLDDVLGVMDPRKREKVRKAIRAKFQGKISGKKDIKAGYSIFLDLPEDIRAAFMSALRSATTDAQGAKAAMMAEAEDANTNVPGIVVIPALEPGIEEYTEGGNTAAKWVGTRAQKEQKAETRTTIMLRRIEIGEAQLYEFTNLLAKQNWDGTNVTPAHPEIPGRTVLEAIAEFDQGALAALMNGEIPGINNLNLPREGIDQARIVALCQGRMELDRVQRNETNRKHYEAEVARLTKEPGAAGELAEAKAELIRLGQEVGPRVVIGRPMAA